MNRPFLPALLFLCVLLRIPALQGDLALNRAVVALINQEPEQVKPLLETAVSKAPQNGRAWWYLGQVLAQTGDVESAVQAWQQLPEEANLLLEYGRMMTRQNISKAIDWYKYAIQVSPHKVDGYYGLGQIYQKQGEWETAVSYYQQALQQNSAHLPSLVALSQFYIQLNQLEQAEIILLQITNNSSFDTIPGLAEETYRSLAAIATKRQDIEQTIYWWERAVISSNTVDNRLHLAEVYEQAGQTAKALAIYQQTVVMAPDTPWTHLALARAYLARQQWVDALESAQNSIEQDATVADAWLAVGQAYMALEQTTRAKEALIQAQILNPSHTEINRLLEELSAP